MLRYLFRPSWYCHSLFGIDDMLIATVGSSLISGLFGQSGQESTNETNIALARENRDFQERMSNTAYQRARADMEKAGFNPMLAYSQGGASAPVGSMPQVQNAAAAGIQSAASGAQMVQAVQQIAQSKAQTDLINAQADKTRTETMERESNAALLLADIEKRRKEGLEIEERIPGVRASSAIEQARKRAELGEENASAPGFKADVDRRKAIALQEQFGVAGAKASADFYKSELGHDSPYLKWMMDFIKVLSGAGNLAGMKR